MNVNRKHQVPPQTVHQITTVAEWRCTSIHRFVLTLAGKQINEKVNLSKSYIEFNGTVVKEPCQQLFMSGP